MNGTLFFVLGGSLAALAVLTSLVGLRTHRFPASNAVMAATMVIFAALVIGTTTFAVFHAKDEQEARAAELKTAEAEPGSEQGARGEPAPPAGTGKAEGAPKKKAAAPAKGPGGTLKLAADPTQIAFNTTQLSSKPGKVTIDFTNPAPIEHDVAIEQNGKQIAVSKLISKGKTSVSANLAPGTYTFLCTVPGHAAAGMEGTLTIK
jgi:plastocyanin